MDDIRQMLDAKCFQNDGLMVRRYRELAYSDKRDRPMLQFADVLIGAVGFAWNGKLARQPDSPKALIAERIRHHAGLPTLAAATPRSKSHFDIWAFALSETP